MERIKEDNPESVPRVILGTEGKAVEEALANLDKVF